MAARPLPLLALAFLLGAAPPGAAADAPTSSAISPRAAGCAHPPDASALPGGPLVIPPIDTLDAEAAWEGKRRVVLQLAADSTRTDSPALGPGDLIALALPGSGQPRKPWEPNPVRGVALITFVDSGRVEARVTRAFPGLREANALRIHRLQQLNGAFVGGFRPGPRGPATTLGLDIEKHPFARWQAGIGFVVGGAQTGSDGFFLFGFQVTGGAVLYRGMAFGLEADLHGEVLLPMTLDDESRMVSDVLPGLVPTGTLSWSLGPGIDLLARAGFRIFGRNLGGWQRPDDDHEDDEEPGDPVWNDREPRLDLSGLTLGLGFRLYDF